MQDLISVIVPVYNAEKYLEQCLVSIVNQTYKNIEIIIINDGSTDKSEEIILKYKNLDSRIRSYYQQHLGSGAARNYGIEKASGKYISFIDSDDYIDLNMLERLYKAIKPGDSFVGTLGLYMVFDEEVKYFERTLEEQQLLKLPNVWSRLYSREIINKYNIRFSNVVIGEDLEFNCKLVLNNNRCTYIKDAFNYYRVHQNSTFHKSIDRLAILEALDGINDYALKHNKYEEYRDYLEFIHIVNVFRAIKGIILQEEYDEEELNRAIEYLMIRYPNWNNNPYIKNNYAKELISLREVIENKKCEELNEKMREVKVL